MLGLHLALCLVIVIGADYLPKNGNWTLLFRQTINGKDRLFKKNEWTRNKETVDAPNYSILGDFEKFRKPDGSFHLFLWYPELGMGNEWVQTSNPVTKTSRGVDNYKAILTPYTGYYWGGLEHNNDAALLDGSVDNSYWWYAIGSTTDFRGGIPGPGIPGPGGIPNPKDDKGSHVVKKVELYIDFPGLNTYAKLEEGGGDCDKDSDCEDGLYCGKNNCAGQFGTAPGGSRRKDDCCSQKHISYCNPKDVLPRSRIDRLDNACCSIDDQCPAGEGDCDVDSDCQGSLICGDNNCKQFHANADTFDDCCVDPSSPPPPNRPEFGYCTSRNPCGKGEGDCATGKDNTCAGDLVCGSNNCRHFHHGAHPKMDCCMDK